MTQQSHKISSLSSAGALNLNMGMFPSGTPGPVSPSNHTQMARPMYSHTMQMAPYHLAGYPGPIAYPGMTGQQTMYSPQGIPYPYQAAPMRPGPYGYMEAAQDMTRLGAGGQGSYPMYAYPQQAMRPPPGMEHPMNYPGHQYGGYPTVQQIGPVSSEGKQHARIQAPHVNDSSSSLVQMQSGEA